MPISSDPEVAESPDLLSVRSRRPPASRETSQQSTTKAVVNKSVVTSNFDIDISDIEDDDEGPDVIPNSEGDAVDEGAGLGGRGRDSQKVEEDFEDEEEEEEEECAVEYNRQAFSPPNTEMLQEFLDDEQQTPQPSGKPSFHDLNLKPFLIQL